MKSTQAAAAANHNASGATTHSTNSTTPTTAPATAPAAAPNYTVIPQRQAVRISVIIPCYNASATIARSIASCLLQPECAEVIVVDDASSDDSLARVAALARADARIRSYPLKQNGGPALARNIGAMLAQQEVLAFLDADDAYAAGAFEFPVLAFQEQAELALLRLGVEFRGFPDDIFQHPSAARSMQILCNTFSGNLMLRKTAFLAVGGFPNDAIFRQTGGEDGAFGYACSKQFLVCTYYDLQAVQVYYHAGAHAEKFFRLQMAEYDHNLGVVAATQTDNANASLDAEPEDEAQQLCEAASYRFVDQTAERLAQLQSMLQTSSRGFRPLIDQRSQR